MTDTPPERLELKLPLDEDGIKSLAKHVDQSILLRLADLYDGQGNENLTRIVREVLPSDKEMFGALSMGQGIQAKIPINDDVTVCMQMITSQDVEDCVRKAIKGADGNSSIYNQLNTRWQLAYGLLSINDKPDSMVPVLPMFADGDQLKAYNDDREKRVNKMFAHLSRMSSTFVALLSTTQGVFEREVGNRIRKMNVEESVGNSTRTPKS